jgi:hypothetical protein
MVMIENLQKVVVGNPVERKLETTRYHENEIDVIQLIIKLFSIVARHRMLLLVTIALGMLAGVTAYMMIKPRYKSELVISVPAMQKHEFQRLVTSFQEKLLQEEISGASKTHVEVELSDGAVEQGQSFVISAATSDKETLKELQDALIQHINSNPFVRQQHDVQRNQLMKTVDLLNSEEQKVTSALNETLASRSLYDTDFNVAELEKLKLDMQKERISLMNELNTLNPSSVILDFAPPARPYNKSVVKIFGIAVAISFVLFVLTVFVIEFQRLTRNSQPERLRFFN